MACQKSRIIWSKIGVENTEGTTSRSHKKEMGGGGGGRGGGAANAVHSPPSRQGDVLSAFQ